MQVVGDTSRNHQTGPKVALNGPVDSVGEDVAVHVLSVLSKGLSNATRHSRADEIQIEVSVGREQVRLHISDNGDGFDRPAKVSGLVNLRHRAELLGGTCTIDSAPGKGTRINWSVFHQ
ncbi:ATP-binding protein [Pseudarthrobacter sp. NamB4]|uniref:sensor histidine kinase n=1 Tax=Pseudarthrobacter sp. NamB4 TaxID=2576837 RepID=UPI001F0E2AEF|nr:ATP-binding protein [Pseudarthrobacter sp. NamB4]